MSDRSRRLLWHGMLLFLLGLITGLVPPLFRNPRMGLAAHLEGLLNGTFLIAIGAVWSQVRLSHRTGSVVFRTVLFGTYANWATTTLAAVFGTAAMTPIASGVFKGQPWQEFLVATGFIAVGLAMLVAASLLLWGFRSTAGEPTREGTGNA